MMEQEIDTKDLEDAELLLPWYVAGTLSETETARVDAWLADNPEAQAHLERATEELDVTITSSEELGMPRAAAVNDLMAAIGHDQRHIAQGPTLLERLWDMLSPRYAMAGAAALVLVVAGQAITIGTMVTSQPTSFETASGSTVIAAEVTALVAFKPEISFSDVSVELGALDIRIIDGPKPGGIYQIAAADTDEGRAALETLSANDNLVRFFSAVR